MHAREFAGFVAFAPYCLRCPILRLFRFILARDEIGGVVNVPGIREEEAECDLSGALEARRFLLESYRFCDKVASGCTGSKCERCA
jgi:hypothetical protein